MEVRIFADFNNADSDGFVRLNCVGSESDISRYGIELQPGMKLLLYDGDEFEIAGLVVEPGSEGIWRARVDWAELFGKVR
jgi:hypothetical protein